MKKQQILLVSSGIVLLCLMYFFGRTIPTPQPKDATAAANQGNEATTASNFDVEKVIAGEKQKLSASLRDKVTMLESSVVRGDVKDQKTEAFRKIAQIYRDSAHALVPYAYYTSEAAKLENSEKSLTFAAHFFLDGVRSQQDPELKRWLALEAKELFEKALVHAPENDSLKVGLGSCYLFGNISETPMQGISMIREVTERDPDNMYAQLMLGIGGMISGQYDKAIERLSIVVQKQPRNPEAMVMLAEAYERKGDKENAIRWYESSRKIIGNSEILKEIDHRIADLKK